MKKIIVILSLGVLMMGMTACGNKNEQGAGNETTGNPSTVNQGNSQETVNGGTQESGTGSTEPFDAADGWSEEMQKVKDAVVDALGEDYWPDTPITQEWLEANYGISSDLYEEYLGESPMISGNVDTLLIIKAKDDKVEAVEEALNAYRDNLVSDTMQYPMNVGKIQASRIERMGQYVCFVQLGADTTDVLENGDEAVIAHCLEQNELVLEIIRRNLPDK